MRLIISGSHEDAKTQRIAGHSQCAGNRRYAKTCFPRTAARFSTDFNSTSTTLSTMMDATSSLSLCGFVPSCEIFMTDPR